MKTKDIPPLFYFSNMTALQEKPIPNRSGLLKEPWWQEAVSLFTRISGWVILPLIVGFSLGRWLDQRYGSGQKWFFISLAAAFVISTIGMILQVKKEYGKIASLKSEKTPTHERDPRDNSSN